MRIVNIHSSSVTAFVLARVRMNLKIIYTSGQFGVINLPTLFLGVEWKPLGEHVKRHTDSNLRSRSNQVTLKAVRQQHDPPITKMCYLPFP